MSSTLARCTIAAGGALLKYDFEMAGVADAVDLAPSNSPALIAQATIEYPDAAIVLEAQTAHFRPAR